MDACAGTTVVDAVFASTTVVDVAEKALGGPRQRKRYLLMPMSWRPRKSL